MVTNVRLIVLVLGVLALGLLYKRGAGQESTTATTEPVPTPTVDRLAAPSTVESPTQADDGAQLYWLHCQPCHGDRGQGLTDEWRAQYPIEDQYCWESGCHGERPYENGFILPRVVPALIGENSLSRFETMSQLYDFVRLAMPFQDPGNLTGANYLAIMAFLARSNGHLLDGRLDEENVEEIPLRPSPEEDVKGNEINNDQQEEPGESSLPDSSEGFLPLIVILVVLGTMLIAGGVWLWQRYKQRRLE